MNFTSVLIVERMIVFEFDFDSDLEILGNVASLRILAIEQRQIRTYLVLI